MLASSWLTAANLDWTVSPRFEVGYRLPAGFGEITLAYRFMASEGTNRIVGPDGPAVLKSRLDLNMADLDWASREITPWKFWDMKVRFGVRYFYTYFDSQAYESFAEAAAGTGVFNSRTTNSYVGIGPHTALELGRRLGWGLAAVSQLDASIAPGRVRHGFFASSTTPGPDGKPQTSELFVASSQDVPTMHVHAGLSWQPPAYPNVYLFAGYEFEYWWNVGRLSNTFPLQFGEFFDQGYVLRVAINF
jgi:hypothetical protein